MPDEMKTVANNGVYQKDYTVAGTIAGGPAPKGIWDQVKDTVSEVGERIERVNETLSDPNANTVDKVKSIAGVTDGFLGLHDSMNNTTQYMEPYTMSRANDNNLAGYLYARVYAKPNYDAVKRDKAIEIGNKLNINPDVILSASEDGFARAIDISNQMDRGRTYEDITRQYPELLNIRYGSLANAEQTFDNVQDVNKTRGVFDSIQQSLWSMNDQMLLGQAGYKLANAKDETERQGILNEIDRLQNNLQNYRHTDVSDIGSKIIGDSLAQGYMMGVQALKGSNRAVQGMAAGVGIGAIGGASAGGVGALPGAVAGGLFGLGYGAQVGMAEQMYQMSFGSKYIELVQKKDANGNRVYSANEAYSMAQKFAAVDTGIEFFAMKLGAKAVTKATPASKLAASALTTGVDTSVATLNKGMGAVIGQAVKRGVKAGIPELVEEGLQDVNEKVQHNLFRKDNDPEGAYSIGDITSGAISAMAQAAPSVIGLTGLGGIAGGLRAGHDIRKWNSLTVEQQNAALQAEQNRNAQTLMANIRNDAKTNKLAKDNPEVYGQLVQKYAQNAQVPTAYVNVHELVETPEGQNAIREMVDAGIVTDEQVAKSIEAETSVEVPLGQFAQKATNLSDNAMETMKDTTYYTEGGRSMHTIEKDKESYAQARQEVSDGLKNHKASVKQEIIAEHFPDATESQKEVLNEVLDAPDDVKRTYNAAVLQAQTDFREKYNSEYQNFQMAKKSGFDISPESEDSNGSNVTIAEKERTGVIDYNRRLETEVAKNDPDAIGIINQKYDEMAKEANAISEIESLGDTVNKISDGEVAMRMNFSKEGYQVFQDVYKALQGSSNKEVSQSAKQSALLFASHADVMANIMQKAGNLDFTAKDYMDKYISIQSNGKKSVRGFAQTEVISGKNKLKADTKVWGKLVDDFKAKKVKGYRHRVMNTPLVYQMIGFPGNDIYIDNNVLNKVFHEKHNGKYDIKRLKGLPGALANPIAIFENYDSRSKSVKANSFVAVVEVASKKGDLTNIPIMLNEQQDGHFIMSVFPRENKDWYKKQIENNHLLYINRTKKDAISEWRQYGSHATETTSIYYNIPNEEDLRKALEEHPGVYQEGREAEVIRGMTSLMSDDKKIIELFDHADFSTFVHESGHTFLEDLRMLATMEGAPEQVVSDWEEVKKWTGYKEGASADTNRKAHEKFAQGFEAYVRDGSAPTKPLQRAFRQFAQWLTKLYQKVSMLGGKPPKAIRDVMDRMLATEQDIEAWASDREIDRLESKVNMKELSEQEQAALNDKVANIKERAKEKVRAEYISELEQQKVIPWEDVKDEAQARIEKQLADQYPIYKERARYEAFGAEALANTEHPTLKALEEAEETDGIGKWHNVVDEQLKSAEEAYRASDRSTVDNATLAEEWLLTHEAEQRLRMAEADMIKEDIRKASARHYRALAKLQKIDTSKGDVELQLKQALGDLTERERKRIERTIAKDGVKKDKLIERLQGALMQMRSLRDMHTDTLNSAMRKAESRLGGLTISQATKYKRFVRESVTAGKKADIAFSKGKSDLAYTLKQEQLMKTSMARVSFEINQEVEKERVKLLKQLQRIGSAKSAVKLDPQARYWYQHMMYQLGLSNRDGMMPADGNFDLTSVYAVLDADALLSDGSTKEVVPPSVGAVWFSKTPLGYKQMSVDDFREVSEMMNAIYHNGRTEYEASTIKDDKGNTISVDQASAEIVEQISKTMGGIPDKNLLDKINSESWKEKASNSIGGRLLELAKLETIANVIDGGQKGGGVFYRYVYEPINRATNDAKERSEVAMKWLSSAISNSYTKEELFKVRNIKAYKLGEVSNMTKEQVIATALNWGTEANRQRVLETFKSTEVEVEKALSEILTDKDWNFIESTWNHINSYFDERNKVQERMYGTPMKKEQGIKFTIAGREIEGQYYPIVYDPRLDSKSSDYAIEDIIKSQMSSNAVMGMGLSATKKRMASVKGKKLMLSLDVIPSAITESINHIAMREAVTDVNNLVNNHAVEGAIVQTLGRDVHNFMKQWVRDNWQTEISKTSKWDRLLSTLRRNSTFAVMGYRTSTALLNVLNIVPAMHKMGPINALAAVKSFYLGNYMDKRRLVMDKSIFLRERIQNLDKDMKNGLKIDGKSPFTTGDIVDHSVWKAKEIQEEVNRYGYFFITETDLMLSMPIWMHEYESKKAELIGKEGYSPEEIESRAIEAGDRMVRSVFGSGDTKDQAGVQRKNNSLVNLFTPFYSYSNTVFNALLEAGWLSKNSGNWLKLAHAFLFWIVLQSVAETLLRSLWDDEDDAKTIAGKTIKSIGSASVQGFPVVRDILGAAGSAITGETTTTRGSEVVALSMTSKLAKTFGDAYKGTSKVTPADIGRSATEVANRLVPGGFSDTLTDGAWTLAKWLTTDTDATVMDLATAIIFDKKIRTKAEQKKFDAYKKRQEHSK